MRLHAGLVALCAFLLAAPAPTIDVYMIGDSTMADKPSPDANPERGGQLLPRFFDDQVAVHNFAVNGRSTKSFIDEGKWGAVEDTHGAYPQAVREVAKSLSVLLIDLQPLTENLVRVAGPEGSKHLYVWVAPGESKMYPEGHQDDTHLSLLGATSVARLAASALRETSLPLAQHVRGMVR